MSTTEVRDMKTVALEDLAPEVPELRVADRCDACGAQAFVIVGKGSAMLWLCAHHAHKHREALVADEWVMVADTRDTINAKPSPASVDDD